MADTGAPDGSVEVRRSARRRRTVSAHREGERTVVLIPDRFSRAEERRWVREMLARLERASARRGPRDEQLQERATALSERYLGGHARPTSVRWSANQASRWGSCSPVEGTIRISDRCRDMPRFVLDYVLLHELAHLLRPSHDREFWSLLRGYAQLDRARGYLEGYAAAAGSAGTPGSEVDDGAAADMSEDPSEDPAETAATE